MAIDFACESCGKTFSLKDELAGKKGKCTACGATMVIPQPKPERMAPVEVERSPVRASPPPDPVASPSYMPASNVQVVVNQQREGKSANGLGVAAVVLGVLSLLICWVPLVNLVVIPAAFIGGLLGLIGLVVALTNKRSGPGWAIAGMSTNAVAFLVMLMVNAAMASALGEAVEKARKEQAAREAAVVARAKVANPPPAVGEAHAPLAPAPLAPAVVAPEPPDPGIGQVARLGDVEIEVTKVARGKTTLIDKFGLGDGGRGQSAEELLSVYIRVKNASPTRKLAYRTMGAVQLDSGSGSSLKDNLGNSYTCSHFGFSKRPEGQTESASLYPGKDVEDHIVFEPPVEAAESLVLELPAERAGQTKGVFRFRIPTNEIVSQ